MDSNNASDAAANHDQGGDAPEFPLAAAPSQITLWSRCKRVHDLVMGPIRPLVVLVGPISCTTWIKRIIDEQMKQMRLQAYQASASAPAASVHDLPESSKFNLKIHCYDFQHTYRSKQNPSGQLEMPSFYKEQQLGFTGGMFKKHANRHELGHIKLRFFDSVCIFKPAVTLMVFDWQTMTPGSFEWVKCESTVLDEVKSFQDRCQVSAKDTKIILLIMLPLDEEVNVDKCKASLRTAISQQQQDENQGQIVKHVTMIQNGIDGLKSNPKDFVKKIFEQCGQYYANKKRDIKAKQKRLINKEQTENIRYAFKIGIYSQLSKGDFQASTKHIREAYDLLRQSLSSGGLLAKSSLDERRDNADVICLQLLVYLLDQRNYEGFVKQFRSHFHVYKNSFEQMGSSQQPNEQFSNNLAKVEELRWRSNWHMIIAKMLEPKQILFTDSQSNVYQNQKAAPVKSKQGPVHNWLSDTQLEHLFSGYHYLNCMLSLMKRKQELKKIMEMYHSQEGKNLYAQLQEDLKDILLMDKSKMLGRDYTLGKNTNPLLEQSQSTVQGMGGSLGFTTVQAQSLLEKYKMLLQLQGMDDLNHQVLRNGQIALSSYKTKNQLMAQYNVENSGNTYKFMKASCKRMIQFVHYHLSVHIFELKAEQDLILEGKSPLGTVCQTSKFLAKAQLLKDAQRYRDQVTHHLITDGWQPEGIALLEQNREFQRALSREQGKPEDFFKHEMQILNYSKTLQKGERYQRFYDLISMDLPAQTEGKKLVTGQLVGAGLIWARASFDKKVNEAVQVNQWVKLTIEIYTKLKGEGIDIRGIEAKFNEPSFDFEKDGQRCTRSEPITIEQELYLDEAKILNGEMLVLTQLLIRLKDRPVQFSLQPYLSAKDKISRKMEQKGAGLKLPVLIKIEEMPPKLTFKLSPTPQTGQALLGNRHRVDVFISKKQNVNLKTLKLEVDKVDANDPEESLASVDIAGQPGDQPPALQSIDMNTSSATQDTQAPSHRQGPTQNHAGLPGRQPTVQGAPQGTVITVNRKKRGAQGQPRAGASDQLLGAVGDQRSDNMATESKKQGANQKEAQNPASILGGQVNQAAAEGSDHPLGSAAAHDQATGVFGRAEGVDEAAGAAGIDQRDRSTRAGQRRAFAEDTELGDFEIQYQLAQAHSSSEVAQTSELKDLDYPLEKTVNFPAQCINAILEESDAKQEPKVENEQPLLSLYFTFYRQSLHNLSLRFVYAFTQTHRDAGDLLGLQQEKESTEFVQEHIQKLNIHSIQPFDVQWGLIRSSDSFLKINDPQSLAAKKENAAGAGPSPSEMKTALDKNFKVWCKLRNMSSSLALKMESTKLQLTLGSTEEEEDEDDEGAGGKAQAIKLLPDDLMGQTLEPDETVQYISESFKVSGTEVEQLYVNQDQSFAAHRARAGATASMVRAEVPGSGRPTGGTAGNLLFDDFTQIKRMREAFHTSYVVQNPFKLNFTWTEAREPSGEGGHDASGPMRMRIPSSQTIDCSVFAPQSLQLVKIPISVELLGEVATGKEGCPKTALKLEQPIQAKYKIKNLCDDHIFECVALLDDSSKYFYTSGEVRTRFDIMPLDEVVLEYQLLPLYLGRHDLPKLHLIDRSTNSEALQLQAKKLADPAYLRTLKEQNQTVDYLIRGFTKKVLVQN